MLYRFFSDRLFPPPANPPPLRSGVKATSASGGKPIPPFPLKGVKGLGNSHSLFTIHHSPPLITHHSSLITHSKALIPERIPLPYISRLVSFFEPVHPLF